MSAKHRHAHKQKSSGSTDPSLFPETREGVFLGDCVELLGQFASESVDLVFADPPFNIGYEYDVYVDRKERDEYLAWSKSWIKQVYRVLSATGTFWLAIGDDYAAELKLIAQECGFIPRSWVIWYYTFGVNCVRKFTRSHTHLLYFVKHPEQFTFRVDDPEVRIPSARQLVYNDARANPKGRLPDDTWILRPHDVVTSFTDQEDTWYFPRVAGTFKERTGFHGCQMPEQLLGRIIRACSNPGDVVLDPFSGSASTLVVARKLGRRPIGFDISQQYVTEGLQRLADTKPGDPLVGSENPLTSVPSTVNGKKGNPEQRKKSSPKAKSKVPASIAEADSSASLAEPVAVLVDAVPVALQTSEAQSQRRPKRVPKEQTSKGVARKAIIPNNAESKKAAPARKPASTKKKAKAKR